MATSTVGVFAFDSTAVQTFIDDNFTSGDRVSIAVKGGTVMVVIYPSS